MNKNLVNIVGLGTDIIEIHRIYEAIQNHGSRFLNKVFTEKEIAYCSRYKNWAPHFAGRFAAKEAFLKAMGTGLSGSTSWVQIEILNDALGKPEIHLSSNFKTHFSGPFLLSISHCRDYATATVIAFSSS